MAQKVPKVQKGCKWAKKWWMSRNEQKVLKWVRSAKMSEKCWNEQKVRKLRFGPDLPQNEQGITIVSWELRFRVEMLWELKIYKILLQRNHFKGTFQKVMF